MTSGNGRSLDGKIALVTGASQGIGRAIAEKLAENGASVVINYLANEEGALQAKARVENFGAKALAFKADISKTDEVAALVAAASKEFGRIDILVNNAGINRDKTMKNLSEEEWNAVISVNLTGVYKVTKAALPLIPEGGRILNVSSIVGIDGNFGQANYSAAKAGVIGFTKTLAKELARKNILVNAIAPGFVETPMTGGIPADVKEKIVARIPLGRMGKAEEIAELAAFLASGKCGYATGSVFRVDGGMTL